MKIDGLPVGNNRLGKIDGVQRSNDTGLTKQRAAAHGAEVERDRLEVAGFVVEADFEPRAERMESVMQRLGSDGYRDAEVTATIAERLVQTDVSADTTVDLPDIHPVRHEHVERAGSNISSDYYDTEEVVRTIAERIASAIGLDDLFNDTPG